MKFLIQQKEMNIYPFFLRELDRVESIVFRLVKSLNRKITVHREKGKGTTFTLLFYSSRPAPN